jgi:hypothetical protein
MTAHFTIDPTKVGFSREVALYLANACDLAYMDDPTEAARALLGLEALGFDHRESDTQGFVGRAEGFVILAFRGSEPINEHLRDWIVNFQFEQTRDPLFTGEVHSGFSRSLSAAWGDVDQILHKALGAAQEVGADDPGVPLFITGHSLGGALATLASSRLASGEGPARAGVLARLKHVATYTFGAPRVGSPDFCRSYKPFTCRVVNDLDVVPQVPLQGREVGALRDRLPPFTPEWVKKLVLDVNLAPQYGHVESLFHLDDRGVVTEQAAGLSWLDQYVRRSLRSFGRSLNGPLDDHRIGAYIRALAS